MNLGWKAMNPQKILSGLLDGMPVKSANDANVAAWGSCGREAAAAIKIWS